MSKNKLIVIMTQAFRLIKIYSISHKLSSLLIPPILIFHSNTHIVLNIRELPYYLFFKSWINFSENIRMIPSEYHIIKQKRFL